MKNKIIASCLIGMSLITITSPAYAALKDADWWDGKTHESVYSDGTKGEHWILCGQEAAEYIAEKNVELTYIEERYESFKKHKNDGCFEKSAYEEICKKFDKIIDKKTKQETLTDEEKSFLYKTNVPWWIKNNITIPKVQVGWVQSGRNWFYSIDGINWVKNAFMLINGKWYYFHENGVMAHDETLEINGSCRYFNSDGQDSLSKDMNPVDSGWIYADYKKQWLRLDGVTSSTPPSKFWEFKNGKWVPKQFIPCNYDYINDKFTVDYTK